MGLSPEVQKATVAGTIGRRTDVKAATVHNIVARIEGTEPGRAIALAGHYDTMPMTPGASAFVEQHPWSRDIELVLNFEAIGRTGPSIMFETSANDGRLLRELGRVAPYPVAQSWLHGIYKMTPLNTDFNRFIEAGITGLNFVYLADGTVYHTLRDNPQTIDPRSLQHHGSYALSLTRHFGNMDLEELLASDGNAVYFSLFRGLLVSYRTTWAVLPAIFTGLILIGVAIIGFQKKQLAVGGVLVGMLAFLASVIAPTVGALPGIIIFAPTIYVMFHFAPTAMIGITVCFVALLLGLLIPLLDFSTRNRRWALSVAALVAAAGFLVAGSLTAGFNNRHPRPNAVACIMNADTGQATWFSPGTAPHEWTSQFFQAEYESGRVGELFPLTLRDRRQIVKGKAPAVPLKPPNVEVLSDVTSDGIRMLRLRLSSVRLAPVLSMDVKPSAAVRAIVIADKRIENPEESDSPEKLWNVTYYALPQDGIELMLELDAAQPFQIQVADHSRELPGILGQTYRARPDDMIPMPNFDYMTVVVKSLDIP